MPEEHPLFVSPQVAAEHGLSTGQRTRIVNRETNHHLDMTVEVNSRLVGDLVYVPFSKDQLQRHGHRYINRVTSQTGRCSYTQQTNFKTTEVSLEKLSDA